MYSGNNILLTILQHFLGGILQTSHRSSHTSIILIVTPTASRINGTGMKAAADSNTFKACFPVAMIYCAVERMTSRGFSEDIWIQNCVRDKTGYESILLPPPWNSSPYLGPRAPHKYAPSLPRQLLVHFQPVPVCRCASADESRIWVNPLTAALIFDSKTRSSTEVHSFVPEMFASSFSGSSCMQWVVKKFAQSDHCWPQFSTFCL